MLQTEIATMTPVSGKRAEPQHTAVFPHNNYLISAVMAVPLRLLSWGLVGVHYLVSIVMATRALHFSGMAFGCQSLVTIDFLGG